ncbi:MAG: hypothetical protein KGL92_12255 [Gammaproteobacteria bacterium]|nr:hypothetical protein [Gammaproteobacteria bacterium]
MITPSTNLWYCFGCNAGGSVVDWAMRKRMQFSVASAW